MSNEITNNGIEIVYGPAPDDPNDFRCGFEASEDDTEVCSGESVSRPKKTRKKRK